VPRIRSSSARRRRLSARSRRFSEALKNRFVRSRGYWQNADRIGEDLTRSENYLSLVGLVILIWRHRRVERHRVFVQQKVRSIAILKCLGGTSARVLAIYMSQVLALGARAARSAWCWRPP